MASLESAGVILRLINSLQRPVTVTDLVDHLGGVAPVEPVGRRPPGDLLRPGQSRQGAGDAAERINRIMTHALGL